MKLPNAERAVVDIAKLRDYCLNPTHPRGRHEARVFLATLGLTAADAEELQVALLQTALTDEAAEGDNDAYGQRYVLGFVMTRAAGQAQVRSAWIVRVGEDFPVVELLCVVRRG